MNIEMVKRPSWHPCDVCGTRMTSTLFSFDSSEACFCGYLWEIYSKSKEVSLYLCSDCLDSGEKNFIRTMPLDQVPLYINHLWINNDSCDILKERLVGQST